ncbi:MAG TPA: rRNA maturation RNase YbeY [Saprospiraceae bacterium]|nr:rRNA maturation RNase YbeY [Saprospiraceae bacterium]
MSLNISLFSENTNFIYSANDRLSSWIQNVLEEERKKGSNINFIFCDDATLHALNVEYLKHDTYTDIITFPLSEDKTIGGDIYISVDRVRENAYEFKSNFDEELHRVIIHGILHLCGYKDKTPEDQLLMRKKENHYLEGLPSLM